jgi:hypothetical protein
VPPLSRLLADRSSAAGPSLWRGDSARHAYGSTLGARDPPSAISRPPRQIGGVRRSCQLFATVIFRTTLFFSHRRSRRRAASLCRPTSCKRYDGSATSTGSSTSTTRSRPAAGAPAPYGRSSNSTSNPTCWSPASHSAAASRCPPSPTAPTHDSVQPGGLAAPSEHPVCCAAAIALLDELASPGFRDRAGHVGELMRRRLEEIASRQSFVGEVRGVGPMLARETRRAEARTPQSRTAAALQKGLILLSCGLYGNV